MRLLNLCILALIAMTFHGCIDPDIGKKSEEDKPKTNPAGGPNDLEKDLDKKIKANNQAQGKTGNLPKFNNRRVSGKRGLVGMMSDRVYDYHQVIKLKPTLKVVQKPSAQTVYSRAFFSATAQYSKRAFEHNLRLLKELNGGRWPTYKQYTDSMRKMRMNLSRLPPFAIYAYNDKTGKLLILEDPAVRKRHQDASR